MINLIDNRTDIGKEALNFFLAEQILKFGSFTLKSGRSSPYFFNTGLLCSGEQLIEMGRLYASLIRQIEERSDASIIFGSAYKGIPIATATSMIAASNDLHYRAISDRKEAKTHGDKSGFLGDVREGDRAIIVDDVITDGATKMEAIEKLKEAGVVPIALVIAFDRQEPASDGGATAVESFSERTGLPVYSLLSVRDVIEERPDLSEVLEQHLASFAA